MANLPRIKRLLKEDFPGQPWIDALLGPLNQFMDSVFTALAKGLTFKENFSAVEKVLEFRENSAVYPIKFAWSQSTIPNSLLVTRVVGPQPSAAVFATWSFDGTSIAIEKFFGLQTNQNYKVTVLAFTS